MGDGVKLMLWIWSLFGLGVAGLALCVMVTSASIQIGTWVSGGGYLGLPVTVGLIMLFMFILSLLFAYHCENR